MVEEGLELLVPLRCRRTDTFIKLYYRYWTRKLNSSNAKNTPHHTIIGLTKNSFKIKFNVALKHILINLHETIRSGYHNISQRRVCRYRTPFAVGKMFQIAHLPRIQWQR